MSSTNGGPSRGCAGPRSVSLGQELLCNLSRCAARAARAFSGRQGLSPPAGGPQPSSTPPLVLLWGGASVRQTCRCRVGCLCLVLVSSSTPLHLYTSRGAYDLSHGRLTAGIVHIEGVRHEQRHMEQRRACSGNEWAVTCTSSRCHSQGFVARCSRGVLGVVHRGTASKASS